MLGANVDDYSY